MYASSCFLSFFLFHDVTSLHPLSFHRKDFSTCYIHFWGQSPMKIRCFRCTDSVRARTTFRESTRTRSCSRLTTPTASCARAIQKMAFVQCLPCKGPRCIYLRKTIARCLCTLPLNLETFGETKKVLRLQGLA